MRSIAGASMRRSIRWDPVAEKVTEGTIPGDILEAPMHNGWKLET